MVDQGLNKIPDLKRQKQDGTILQVKIHAKYLGIILDRELNWRPNTEKRKK